MLEEVVELLESRRQRVPMEAPWDYTQAYARLIIANGFARLGQRERAMELGELARTVLTERPSDAVRKFLTDVCFHRLDCALAATPRTQRLSADLLTKLGALDRTSRYKVDRLLELSSTVAVSGRIGDSDAIGGWIRRELNAAPVATSKLDDMRTFEEPAARVELIAKAFADREADDVVLACIDALTELPNELAVSLIPDLAAFAPGRSPIVRARACRAIAQFGFWELAAPLATSVGSKLSAIAPALLPAVVSPLLRSLRWLGEEREIVATVANVSRVPSFAELPAAFRFLLAGAGGGQGDDSIIEAAIAFASQERLPQKLETLRAICAATSYAARARGEKLVRLISRSYAGITDDYGTSSHYCLSVLQFIEGIVLGICDLELANLNVLDPTSQVLLRSGFAY